MLLSSAHLISSNVSLWCWDTGQQSDVCNHQLLQSFFLSQFDCSSHFPLSEVLINLRTMSTKDNVIVIPGNQYCTHLHKFVPEASVLYDFEGKPDTLQCWWMLTEEVLTGGYYWQQRWDKNLDNMLNGEREEVTLDLQGFCTELSDEVADLNHCYVSNLCKLIIFSSNHICWNVQNSLKY